MGQFRILSKTLNGSAPMRSLPSILEHDRKLAKVSISSPSTNYDPNYFRFPIESFTRNEKLCIYLHVTYANEISFLRVEFVVKSFRL